MGDEIMEFYSTGEVAKKLNISVRTIRYYDQIGLMRPSEKDDNGRRRYSNEDIVTLEKITILKMLHLPLKEIEKVLKTMTTEQILQAHRESLFQKKAELEQSIKHTNTLLNVVHLEGDVNWEELLPLIKEAQNKENTEEKWHEYFDQQEKDILKEKLPKMEEDSPKLKQWMNIIRRIELCLEKGYVPESEEGQIIAEDAYYLSDELFGDNEGLGDKFFEIRKSKEKSQALNLYPIKEDVLQFAGKAMEIYMDKRNETDIDIN